jgi:hypothetical protein
MEIESVQTQVARFAQVYQALGKDNLTTQTLCLSTQHTVLKGSLRF